MRKCTHDLAERESDCADGMCPQCLASERDRLAEEVKKSHFSLSASVKEIDRLKAELETMKALAVYHDARAVRFGKKSDLWKSKCEMMADDFVKNELDRVTWKSRAETPCFCGHSQDHHILK